MTGLKKLLMWKTASDGGGEPSEYQKVGYLISVGQNANINTGVGNNPNLKIACEFLLESYVQYVSPLGNFTSGKKGWRIITSSQTALLVDTYSSGYAALLPPTGTVAGEKLNVVIDTEICKVTDRLGTYEKASPEIEGTDNISNIALGRNIVNASSSSSSTSRMRIYSCKIWEGGTLIRDYIPVVRKSDSVAGFYDRANKTFNPSVSPVQFIAGND